MEKCFVNGCVEKPITGFQEVGKFGTRKADRERFYWCEYHWEFLKGKIAGLRGRFINLDNLSRRKRSSE
jgi:hypothetical protein